MPATTVSAAVSAKRKVAHLVTKGGRAYSLGLTPETATLGGFAMTIEEIPRPGLRPLSRPGSPVLRAYQFTHSMLAKKGGPALVSHARALIRLAREGFEVRMINVSGLEAGIWWRIKDLQVTIAERDKTQAPKRLELSWQLTESFDRRPAIGKNPPPGGMFKADLAPIAPQGGSSVPGADPSDNPGNKPGGSTHDSQVPGRTYMAGSHETLFTIAGIIWGNGYLWPFLFNANKTVIRWDSRWDAIDPSNTSRPTQNRWIDPGTVLAIPVLPSGDNPQPSNPGRSGG